MTNTVRIGNGYDVHVLVEGRRLVLGGCEIIYEKGLSGHSDADVLLHAIMDAMLGAAAEGDIGRHFPDSDERYKDISSLELLSKTESILTSKGYRVGNIDATVVAEKPRIAPYVDRMRANIASVLKISVERINIKGTTTEGLGFTGRGEGIAAYATALILKDKI
ncbi:MAG: 2-C-methyl-D-erythritol 2,4-cyclodiphosphate synthase [Anaerovoracaceae bacterium]